jgi:hypothetical protein
MGKELRSIDTYEEAPTERHYCHHPGRPQFGEPTLMIKEGSFWKCPKCGDMVADHVDPTYPGTYWNPTPTGDIDEKDQGVEKQETEG